jgi:hypothetical protein
MTTCSGCGTPVQADYSPLVTLAACVLGILIAQWAWGERVDSYWRGYRMGFSEGAGEMPNRAGVGFMGGPENVTEPTDGV